MNLTPLVNPNDNTQGNPAAPITLIEYGDYLCPPCAHAYPIVQQIQKDFGDRLRFVFRNFPLRSIHPLAEAAAIAAESAARQNKFWEMHDAIFENQPSLHQDSFREIAQLLGLDMNQFDWDTNDNKILEKVNNDFDNGITSGVNGMPTFFINGVRHNGSHEIDNLMGALNAIASRL